MKRAVSLIVCGAPLAVRTTDIVSQLVADGWAVSVVGTPASVNWIDLDAVAALVHAPVRLDYRSPGESKWDRPPDAVVVCPATYYNHEHRHSGIGLHTPASVHHGTAELIRDQRQQTLNAAYAAHPERFAHQPHPPRLPDQVWINPPTRPDPPPAILVPPRTPRRDNTIYQCYDCDTRYLGQQWCPDCNKPCVRIDLGGLCPECSFTELGLEFSQLSDYF